MQPKLLGRRKLNRQDVIQAYAMIAVSVVGLALFVVYPLAWIIRYCLYSYGGPGTTVQFVGLGNFIEVFTASPRYWQAVGNTFIFAFGKLSVELSLALVLAVVLARRLRGRDFFRTVFFLPSMLSVAVMGVVFYYLFGTFNGVVNDVIMSLGGSRILWFTNGTLAMIVLMITSIWQNFGLNMILFMTGLQSIPLELYEAATIDGANSVQQFFRVTIPMLGPVMQMVVLNAVLGSLKLTALSLVLTDGQPNGHTEVMMSYIYKLFFTNRSTPDWGYGSALMLMTAIILGIFTAVYLRLTAKSSEIY